MQSPIHGKVLNWCKSKQAGVHTHTFKTVVGKMWHPPQWMVGENGTHHNEWLVRMLPATIHGWWECHPPQWMVGENATHHNEWLVRMPPTTMNGWWECHPPQWKVGENSTHHNEWLVRMPPTTMNGWRHNKTQMIQMKLTNMNMKFRNPLHWPFEPTTF